MAALGSHPGRRHAAGAAADDQDLLGLRSRDDGIVLFMVAQGIDRAMAVLTVAAGEHTLVAADTGHDVLISARFDLLHPIGVRQHLVPKTHDIGDAVLNDGVGFLRVRQLALGDHRDGDDLLDRFGSKELMAFLVIAGGDGLVPRVVATHIHVQGIHASLLVHFRHLQALGQIMIAGLVAHGMSSTELHDDGEVVTAGLPDLGDNLHGKAHPVFQTATIFIRAGIPERGLELVDQIAAVAM